MAKIKVDPVKCIGCGLCVSIAEEIFRMNNEGKSEVVEKPGEKSSEKKVKEAIEACPVRAISASN